ncbi:hypothetical protein YC2023_013860 [Brassica napus]
MDDDRFNERSFDMTIAYNKDPSPIKLNLGIGAYRTEEGKPLVLNVVRKAEQQLINDRFSSLSSRLSSCLMMMMLTLVCLICSSRVKEYLPIVGLVEFNKLSAKLILGADRYNAFLSDWWFFTYAWLSPAIRENRVTTVECLSGTGSLRVGGEAGLTRGLRGVLRGGLHHKRGRSAMRKTPDQESSLALFRGPSLLEDIGDAPPGSIVLLHACAHNPTGVDPTLEQWEQIRKLMRSKGLMSFFDSAYQVHLFKPFLSLLSKMFNTSVLKIDLGIRLVRKLNLNGFASGSLDTYAKPIRMFVVDGGECLVAQSYAKNMGLYGERRDTGRVESQLKLVIRPMYSNPPIHGASIVAVILRDRNLFNEWTLELKAMADRIISMRKQLFEALSARGTPGDWSHIIKHIGMFTFTGLNSAQVSFMTKEYHVYMMTSDGRISMAGLSSKTVPHLADSIHAAVTKHV